VDRVSAAIPHDEPPRLHAGDTAKWLKALPDYPASDGWVLSYALVNSLRRISFSASASADEHLVNVPAATTALWVAGSYSWRAQVTLASDVFTVAGGSIQVVPAFNTATDGRSAARRMLDAVQAALEGRAVSGVNDLVIGGRSVKYMPVPDLLVLRDRLRLDVAREEAAGRAEQGLAPRGRVVVRFGA
jgi:hypothetical protein